MKYSLIFLLITALSVLAFIYLKPSQIPLNLPATPTTQPSNLPQTPDQTSPKVGVVASNLQVPWALAFLPDGSIIVTERGGTVKKIAQGDVKTITTIPVKQVGEGGLHGVAIHPDFDRNKFIYFYYTYSEDGGNTLNKVVRYQYSEIKLAVACPENDPNCQDRSTPRLTESQTIVDNIPGATNHDGGRIKFGPDKLLYITTGDAQEPSLAQDKTSLAGKILSVTDDGKPAPGNPFRSNVGPFTNLEEPRNFIYSLGHRNPQGITWDNNGNLWEVEHGQSATDEINKIELGRNYGWPEIRGGQTKEGMESPILQSGSDTWAPAGLAHYKDSLYFGGLRGQALYQVELHSDRIYKREQPLEIKVHFKGEFGRIRDVVLGPDNMLYITTSNRDGRGNPSSDDDKILKINPELL